VSDSGRLSNLVARLTGRWTLQRLAEVEEKVVKFGRAEREELASQRQAIDRLASSVASRASAAAVHELQRRMEDLQQSFAHQDRAFAEAFERARVLDEQGTDDRRFARRIGELLRHDRPIVVGPWTGEVGFELLYWVPFVRWVVNTYGLAPERLLVVSRGGVQGWYGNLAARYADVFTYFTPDEFRAATEDAKKQRLVGKFDTVVLKRVLDAHNLGRADLLHPGMMYRLFMPFWRQIAPMARVEQYATYSRIEPTDDAVLRGLPEKYVAARFYFSGCFPETPANRAHVESIISAISREVPVVLLNTPFAVDDHRDMPATGGRVHTVDAAHMAPERNLAVQTAVIARAQAFVGTYGGYSYLAPFCGVPSLAFYSEQTYKVHHLHAAQHMFERLGDARLVPLDVASFPLVRLALSQTLAGAPR
jgi:hypothetical protein